MKIAICVPHHGDVKAGFAKCLAELVGYSLSKHMYVGLNFEDAGPIDYKRNKLAAVSKKQRADYILWIDADHTFPRDGLVRLLSADKLIIGCNYPNRRFSSGPSVVTCFGLDGRKPAMASGIENVAAMGLGFCLTKAEVFDKIPKPWFASRYEGDAYIGHDVNFFNHARQAGISVFVENDLSRQVGHIAERVLTLDAP